LYSKFFGQANGAKGKSAPTQQTKLSFTTKASDNAKKTAKEAAAKEEEEEVKNEVEEEVEKSGSDKGMRLSMDAGWVWGLADTVGTQRRAKREEGLRNRLRLRRRPKMRLLRKKMPR
jgi:hypothetical protein